MFSDREKELILKVNEAREGGQGMNGGPLYIKYMLQYFSTTDRVRKNHIWKRMETELSIMVSQVTPEEIWGLGDLLRKKCEEASPRKVREEINALIRKATVKKKTVTTKRH